MSAASMIEDNGVKNFSFFAYKKIVGDINYGGRVTDNHDRSLIGVMLNS